MRRRHFVLSSSFGTSYRPVVNPVTGQLQGWLQGSGTLHAQADKVGLTATVDGTQTIPLNADNEVHLFGASLVGTYSPGKVVGFTAGYRSVWQGSRNPLLDTLPRQWVLFAGLTLSAPSIRL